MPPTGDPHKLAALEEYGEDDLKKNNTEPLEMIELPAREVKQSQLGCFDRGLKTVVDFLDLTLLFDPVYVNIALGISFALYSDVAFFTIQPVYLFSIGISKSDAALIISIGAATDLISRLFLSITSSCVQVKSRDIYLAGAVFTIVARFGMFPMFTLMLSQTRFLRNRCAISSISPVTILISLELFAGEVT